MGTGYGAILILVTGTSQGLGDCFAFAAVFRLNVAARPGLPRFPSYLAVFSLLGTECQLATYKQKGERKIRSPLRDTKNVA